MSEVTLPSFPRSLDLADPLHKFPSEFVVTDSKLCYLDGNSLGRIPQATLEALPQFLALEWASELVDGWSHWIDEAERAGDQLAEVALGSGPGQTLVCDSTSVNLYQLLRAVVDSRSDKSVILVDSANFPTDRYIAHGIARETGRRIVTLDVDGLGGPGAVVVDTECDRLTPELLEPHLTDEVAVLTVQAVNYRSGARPDISGINELASRRGIPVVWDCSHAVGSISLNFDESGVDLAVGCTYKYLNSGPGSPGWLFVRRSAQEHLSVPIQGWFAQAEQFVMGPEFERAEGIRGFQIASPPIMGIRAVQSSLDLLGRAGIDEVEAKSRVGTSMMIELYDQWLKPLGCELRTPRDPAKRGAHITLWHPEAKSIARGLRELARVIPDFREPSSIRLAISPLANSYFEVWEGMRRMRDLIQSGDYRSLPEATSRVT